MTVASQEDETDDQCSRQLRESWYNNFNDGDIGKKKNETESLFKSSGGDCDDLKLFFFGDLGEEPPIEPLLQAENDADILDDFTDYLLAPERYEDKYLSQLRFLSNSKAQRIFSEDNINHVLNLLIAQVGIYDGVSNEQGLYGLAVYLRAATVYDDAGKIDFGKIAGDVNNPPNPEAAQNIQNLQDAYSVLFEKIANDFFDDSEGLLTELTDVNISTMTLFARSCEHLFLIEHSSVDDFFGLLFSDLSNRDFLALAQSNEWHNPSYCGEIPSDDRLLNYFEMQNSGLISCQRFLDNSEDKEESRRQLQNMIGEESMTIENVKEIAIGENIRALINTYDHLEYYDQLIAEAAEILYRCAGAHLKIGEPETVPNIETDSFFPYVREEVKEAALEVNVIAYNSIEWLWLIRALTEYGDCSDFEDGYEHLYFHDQELREQIMTNLFPSTHSFDDGNLIVRSSLPFDRVLQLYLGSKEVKAQFFRLLNENDPVQNSNNEPDQNEQLVAYIFDKKKNSRFFSRYLFDHSGKNSVYIEADSKFFTYEDSTHGIDYLFRHEYSHYLQGRYLVPDYWKQGKFYCDPAFRLSWLEEGMADMLAGATRSEGCLVLTKNFDYISDESSFDDLHEVLTASNGETNLLYKYGSCLWHHLYQEKRNTIRELFAACRADDPAEFATILDELDNSSNNENFHEYLELYQSEEAVIEHWMPWNESMSPVTLDINSETELLSWISLDLGIAGYELEDELVSISTIPYAKLTKSIGTNLLGNDGMAELDAVSNSELEQLLQPADEGVAANLKYATASFVDVTESDQMNATLELFVPLRDPNSSPELTINFYLSDSHVLAGQQVVVANTSFPIEFITDVSWEITGSPQGEETEYPTELIWDQAGTYSVTLSINNTLQKTKIVHVYDNPLDDNLYCHSTLEGNSGLVATIVNDFEDLESEISGITEIDEPIIAVSDNFDVCLSSGLIEDVHSVFIGWIDWNRDGVFQEGTEANGGEQVLFLEDEPYFAGSIAVPDDAQPGPTLFRVKFATDYEEFVPPLSAPCDNPSNSGDDGEVTDFLLMIKTGSDVSLDVEIVSPEAGQNFDYGENIELFGAAISCDDFGVVLAEVSYENDIIASIAGGSLDFRGLDALSNFPIGDSQELRLTVYNQFGESASANLVFSVGTETDPYCDGYQRQDENQDLNYILNVQLMNETENIEILNIGDEIFPEESYNLNEEEFEIPHDLIGTLSLTINYDETNTQDHKLVGVWVDWNNDNDFYDKGEEITIVDENSADDIIIPFAVPNQNSSPLVALVYDTPIRMRIRYAEERSEYFECNITDNDPSNDYELVEYFTVDEFFPCGYLDGEGETEDYVFRITPPPTTGCTDMCSPNYNPEAVVDDGSCEVQVLGCTNPDANNFDPEALCDDETCDFSIIGCTDMCSPNYNPEAVVDDGSCDAQVLGCTNPDANNFDPEALCDDETCEFSITGCTDMCSPNYNPEAVVDDGSCEVQVLGCTNPDANNFDPEALCDDETCDFSIIGCTDMCSPNYNPAAVVEDGSCEEYDTLCNDSCPFTEDSYDFNFCTCVNKLIQTACDDGDSFTTNDQLDTNCECVGTSICQNIPDFHISTPLTLTESAHWNLSENPYGTTEIYVNAPIMIESGATLDLYGLQLRFGLEGRIIVSPGGELKLDHTKLTGTEECGNMWPGVSVLGPGSLNARTGLGNSESPRNYGIVETRSKIIIADALIGISTFLFDAPDYDAIHSGALAYQSELVTNSSPSSYSVSPLLGVPSLDEIQTTQGGLIRIIAPTANTENQFNLNNCIIGIDLGGYDNDFNENVIDEDKNGTYINNVTFDYNASMYGYPFEMITKPLSTGVEAIGGSFHAIHHCTFNNQVFGVRGNLIRNTRVYNNDFTNCSRAISLNDAMGASAVGLHIAYNNVITDCAVGIQASGTAVEITENTIQTSSSGSTNPVGMFTKSIGILLFGTDYIAENNTIADRGIGIYAQDSEASVNTIIDNTFNRVGAGIMLRGNHSSNAIQCNHFNNNRSSIYLYTTVGEEIADIGNCPFSGLEELNHTDNIFFKDDPSLQSFPDLRAVGPGSMGQYHHRTEIGTNWDDPRLSPSSLQGSTFESSWCAYYDDFGQPLENGYCGMVWTVKKFIDIVGIEDEDVRKIETDRTLRAMAKEELVIDDYHLLDSSTDYYSTTRTISNLILTESYLDATIKIDGIQIEREEEEDLRTLFGIIVNNRMVNGLDLNLTDDERATVTSMVDKTSKAGFMARALLYANYKEEYPIDIYWPDFLSEDEFSVLFKAELDNVSTQAVTIFPVPAKNQLTIEFASSTVDDDYQFQLFDLNGKLVRSNALDNVSNTIQLAGLAKGTYFVHIAGATLNEKRKICIH